MNDELVMRPSDTFVASECGCSVVVITGPSDDAMAIDFPKCCCGHAMLKEARLLGGVDVFDRATPKEIPQLLPGMLE